MTITTDTNVPEVLVEVTGGPLAEAVIVTLDTAVALLDDGARGSARGAWRANLERGTAYHPTTGPLAGARFSRIERDEALAGYDDRLHVTTEGASRSRTYIYELEGHRTTGTLADYCRAIEVAAYSGLEVGPLLDLYGTELVVAKTTNTADDYLNAELRVLGVNEVARYRIDLRA